MGTREETSEIWNLIKKEGRRIGYRANDKSKAYGVHPEKKELWNDVGLNFGTKGLEVSGAALDTENIVRSFAEETFNKFV